MDLEVVPKSQLDAALLENWKSKGVVICHKNTTRFDLNNKIRDLLGLPKDLLESGEPLLVTKNNYELEVYNGEVFNVNNVNQKYPAIPITDRFKNKTKFLNFQEIDLIDDAESSSISAIVCPQEIFGKVEDMSPTAISKGSAALMRKKYSDLSRQLPHLHANLGYVLTCQKSQGSQWSEVLVVAEDSVKLTSQEGRRWYYTALSRCEKRVRVCI